MIAFVSGFLVVQEGDQEGTRKRNGEENIPTDGTTVRDELEQMTNNKGVIFGDG